MDIADLLLTPFYIIFLYFLVRLFYKRRESQALNRYYFIAFWLKIVACLAYSLYYFYVFPADVANLYYPEGLMLYKKILQDPANLRYLFTTGKHYDFTFIETISNRGYFFSEANFFVIKVTTLACFFAFGKFIPVNLLFAGLGFAGIWRLFLFFYSLKPYLHGAIAAAILFFPSIIFWTSGISKDTIAAACLGFICLAFYHLFFLGRSPAKNIPVLLLFAAVLAVVKVYILAAFLPFLFLFYLLTRIKQHPIFIIRLLLFPLLILFCGAVSFILFTRFEDALGKYALEEITTSIAQLSDGLGAKTGDADAASNFDLGAHFEPSVAGLIQVAPFAVVATFFRPFIWEVSKVSQLLAALESAFLILFLLYVLLRSRVYKFLYYVVTDPLIIFCFFFAVAFGIFIGASTVNFGTLVRYKVPCLPFFTLSLVFILDRAVKFRSGSGVREASTK